MGGQPLYKLAREGKTVERKARPIEIYSITYGGSPAENEYVLEVTCSKGTYIRTLLEDIADALGQKGTMSALRRTCAGLYTEADAHTLEEILAAKEQGPAALEALMLPVESAAQVGARSTEEVVADQIVALDLDAVLDARRAQ